MDWGCLMKHVIDIETDHLNAKKIWVVCSKTIGKNEVHVHKTKEEFLSHGFDFDNDVFIGHNAVEFDFPVLKRLWNVDIKKVEDTLIMSRLFVPDREGGHSLESWGCKLGISKLKFIDFEKLSEKMIEYCKRDVEITYKIYSILIQEGKDFSQQSIDLEHEIADIISRQSKYGFYLNKQKTFELINKTQSKANEIECNITKYFPPKVKVIRNDLPKYTKKGVMSKVGLNGFDYKDVAGPFWKIEFQPFNIASHKQIVERMNESGWKPIDLTPKGSPKVNETNLATLPETAPESVRKLSEWKMLTNRWKTAESWIDALGDDGRVHGKVFTLGAVTGRMTHNDPNMANVVAVDKPYGKESRDCWSSPNESFRIVGMDAQGLELRMLAHYMNDADYTKEVLSGDPHNVTMQALGIDDRKLAKTFFYAFVYGASPTKLGSILGVSPVQGKILKDQFLKNVPSLGALLSKVEDAASRGYIRGLDGRRLYVRHAHAALNTLLQGGGSIVCKQWSVNMDRSIRSEKLKANLVNTVHDELQYESHADDAKRLVELSSLTIKEAGRMLNLRLPMDAEAKIGMSWADTH